MNTEPGGAPPTLAKKLILSLSDCATDTTTTDQGEQPPMRDSSPDHQRRNSMYTKGPLETRRVDGAGFIAIARVGYMPHASVFACGTNNQPINETVEADARLYATSPKLLEAAEDLIETWGKGDIAAAVTRLADAVAEAKG